MADGIRPEEIEAMVDFIDPIGEEASIGILVTRPPAGRGEVSVAFLVVFISILVGAVGLISEVELLKLS